MKLIKQETCNNDPWTELDRFFGQAFTFEPESYTRAIPLTHYSTEDAKIIEMELPGVDKKDMNLSLERGVLEVEATRKSGRPGSDKEIKLAQSIRIGTEIDFKKADAKLENGLLTITLPRREQDKPFKISIN